MTRRRRQVRHGRQCRRRRCRRWTRRRVASLPWVITMLPRIGVPKAEAIAAERSQDCPRTTWWLLELDVDVRDALRVSVPVVHRNQVTEALQDAPQHLNEHRIVAPLVRRRQEDDVDDRGANMRVGSDVGLSAKLQLLDDPEEPSGSGHADKTRGASASR